LQATWFYFSDVTFINGGKESRSWKFQYPIYMISVTFAFLKKRYPVFDFASISSPCRYLEMSLSALSETSPSPRRRLEYKQAVCSCSGYCLLCAAYAESAPAALLAMAGLQISFGPIVKKADSASLFLSLFKQHPSCNQSFFIYPAEAVSRPIREGGSPVYKKQNLLSIL